MLWSGPVVHHESPEEGGGAKEGKSNAAWSNAFERSQD